MRLRQFLNKSKQKNCIFLNDMVNYELRVESLKTRVEIQT